MKTQSRDVSSSVPSTADKVSFLLDPDSYPELPAAVDAIETHFAWVFLTQRYAYKLKKPVHLKRLDFRTVTAREHDCREELRLNRRLAADAYLDVIPLGLDSAGKMHLGGPGKPVDWLVKMRRLPIHLQLDRLIQRRAITDEQLRALTSKLVSFYQRAEKAELSATQYQERLAARIDAIHRELSREEFALDKDLTHLVWRLQRAFLEKSSGLLGERARQHNIVEAHGDLRPEHIFVGAELEEPMIIDCLEFDRDLRILDCLEELAFLGLECDRLDAPGVGERILALYRETSGDEAPDSLIRFYKSLRASVRAELSVSHRLDPDVDDSPRWTVQGAQYLEMARTFLASCH